MRLDVPVEGPAHFACLTIKNRDAHIFVADKKDKVFVKVNVGHIAVLVRCVIEREHSYDRLRRHVHFKNATLHCRAH